MKVLSTKLDNVAEQKTCGLFSLLPNSLQCDLQQTTSCLSLCGTEVTCLLPSCATYGQATMMMHTAQRWHTQYKTHTYLSKTEFYPLRIQKAFIHYWNCQKTHSIPVDEETENGLLTWQNDIGMATKFIHSVHSVHFSWTSLMQNEIKAKRSGQQN